MFANAGVTWPSASPSTDRAGNVASTSQAGRRSAAPQRRLYATPPTRKDQTPRAAGRRFSRRNQEGRRRALEKSPCATTSSEPAGRTRRRSSISRTPPPRGERSSVPACRRQPSSSGAGRLRTEGRHGPRLASSCSTLSCGRSLGRATRRSKLDGQAEAHGGEWRRRSCRRSRSYQPEPLLIRLLAGVTAAQRAPPVTYSADGARPHHRRRIPRPGTDVHHRRPSGRTRARSRDDQP